MMLTLVTCVFGAHGPICKTWNIDVGSMTKTECVAFGHTAGQSYLQEMTEQRVLAGYEFKCRETEPVPMG